MIELPEVCDQVRQVTETYVAEVLAIASDLNPHIPRADKAPIVRAVMLADCRAESSPVPRDDYGREHYAMICRRIIDARLAEWVAGDDHHKPEGD